MFQTDIIKFLQSFESGALTLLMKAITSLGYESFFILLLIAIMTTVDFKKGFLLIQIILITGIVTQIGKEYFALPRPWFVDNSLLTFGKNLSTSFQNADAKSFFGLLPHSVIEAYRNYGQDSFGFPSGHTSTAVVLWGSIIILFRQRWIKVVSASLIILVPLSRLYLARHFPADIAAGYLLGLVILLIFYFAIYIPNKSDKFLSSDFFRLTFSPIHIIILAYLLFLPILFSLILTGEAIKISGYLLGANAAFILVSRHSYPVTPVNYPMKAINLIQTLSVFAVIGFTLNRLFHYIFNEESSSIVFIESALIILGGIFISCKINSELIARNNR